MSKLYLNEFPKSFLRWLVIIGFLFGWTGTHYVVAMFYDITGCFCIGGIHFHHLYVGSIGMAIIALLYNWKVRGKEVIKSLKLKLALLFLFAFFAGMVFDDIMDHFILQIDPFEWLCGIYC